MDCNMLFRASISRNNNNPPSEDIFSAEKLISIGFLQTEERLKRVEEIFSVSEMGLVLGLFVSLLMEKFVFCFAASKIVNINEITNFSYFL
jgi:hypothetical protein